MSPIRGPALRSGCIAGCIVLLCVPLVCSPAACTRPLPTPSLRPLHSRALHSAPRLPQPQLPRWSAAELPLLPPSLPSQSCMLAWRLHSESAVTVRHTADESRRSLEGRAAPSVTLGSAKCSSALCTGSAGRHRRHRCSQTRSLTHHPLRQLSSALMHTANEPGTDTR